MSVKRPHYVDNRLFLEAFKKYLRVVRPLRAAYNKKCKQALKDGLTKKELPAFARPQTPDYEYIGECLLKIANHLSYSPKFFPNFHNQTLREEMIGDALENCIVYLENFDPKKSSNPFAYFTQVMWYAFYRRITKEAKQTYIKKKSLESAINFFSTQGGDEGEYANTYVKFLKEMDNDVIEDFERRKADKKKVSTGSTTRTRKKIDNPGIERFMVTTS
jgi:hypothetical protein